MARLGDFDASTKRQAWARSRGHCEAGLVCNKEYIGDSPAHYDHILPLWLLDLTDPEQLKRAKSLSNCQVCCWPCHKLKTGDEASDRAKNNRLRAKHSGQIKKKKKKIRSKGFDPTLRKKLNGKVARRDQTEEEC